VIDSRMLERALTAEKDALVAKMQVDKERVETEKQRGLSSAWEARAHGAKALFCVCG
jgi:hypothetical protein